ncbi:MAG: NAD-dependent epimerase/dehydratase family protein [Verrucomicrobiota bacterium]|nr:NAD-dependent epimerase/dehydratase family protein [Verrucomicrobiota bacterium]
MSRGISQEDLDHVAKLIGPCLSAWKGARILVTGASGFVGSWLVETFHHVNKALNLGSQLVGVGAPTDDFAARCPQLLGLDDVTMIRADTRRLVAEFHAQLPAWGDRIDAIIHAAIHVDSRTFDRQPLPTLETAVMGTWEALELARAANVRRFLFVSSGAIYGAQPRTSERLHEDDPVHLDCANYQSVYAEAKRVGETLCAGYLKEHGLPVTIARLFAFVGPHLPIDRHFAIGNFIRDALRGGPILIESDGTPLRSYLYAADLAVWLWTILFNGNLGRPYNVGSERAISLRDAAGLIAQIAPSDVEVRGAPASGPASRYIPSTERARRELGLSETVNLEDALRRTLAWNGLS